MAEQKKPRGLGANGGTKDLKEDEIIARLVPDPAAPPDVIAMVGFLGKSSRPKSWRLYQTLDLKDYVELAGDDIVQSQSLKTDFQPLGGTVLWVKSGARLHHSRSESRVAETEFMQGDITRKFLGGTGTEGLARAGGNVILTTNTWYGQGACCTGIMRWCVMPLQTRNICYYPD